MYRPPCPRSYCSLCHVNLYVLLYYNYNQWRRQDLLWRGAKLEIMNDYVMAHSRWTSGPGAAAAWWLIVLWTKSIEGAVSCWHLHQLILQASRNWIAGSQMLTPQWTKNKIIGIRGGHVPQCPIAGDTTDYYNLLTSLNRLRNHQQQHYWWSDFDIAACDKFNLQNTVLFTEINSVQRKRKQNRFSWINVHIPSNQGRQFDSTDSFRESTGRFRTATFACVAYC